MDFDDCAICHYSLCTNALRIFNNMESLLLVAYRTSGYYFSQLRYKMDCLSWNAFVFEHWNKHHYHNKIPTIITMKWHENGMDAYRILSDPMEIVLRWNVECARRWKDGKRESWTWTLFGIFIWQYVCICGTHKRFTSSVLKFGSRMMF